MPSGGFLDTDFGFSGSNEAQTSEPDPFFKKKYELQA
jgi:hypothetical protein